MLPTACKDLDRSAQDHDGARGVGDAGSLKDKYVINETAVCDGRRAETCTV
jgi:hypothetical protein